jgi:hypothetical protein
MNDIFNGTLAEVISKMEITFGGKTTEALLRYAERYHPSAENYYWAASSDLNHDEILHTEDCTAHWGCYCMEAALIQAYGQDGADILYTFPELAVEYFQSVWEMSKGNKLVKKTGLSRETGFNFLNPVPKVEDEDDINLNLNLNLPETAGQRSTRCANRARRRARALGLGRVHNLAS